MSTGSGGARADMTLAGVDQPREFSSALKFSSSSSLPLAPFVPTTSPPPMFLRPNASASSSTATTSATLASTAEAPSSSPRSPSPSSTSGMFRSSKRAVTGTHNRPTVHLSLLPPKPYHENSQTTPSFRSSLRSPSRVFHEDQPYHLIPLSPSSSTGSVQGFECGNGLLPCPPTSPSGRVSRFSFSQSLAALPYSLRGLVRWASELPKRTYNRVAVRQYPRATSDARSTAGKRLSPTVWVVLYFTLNLSLTLYNKYVLMHFPFPYTMTALHALCGTVGSFVMLHSGLVVQETLYEEKPKGLPEQVGRTQRSRVPHLTPKEMLVVVMFSMLYTVNIVVSNASLKLVTVPFHQVVRGSTPLFTIAISAILFKKRSSRSKIVSLIPVIVGVGFATYGDYYCTLFGFLLTLLGTILAAFKTVLTNFFLRPPGLSSPSLTSGYAPHGKAVDPLSRKHSKVPSLFKYRHSSTYTLRGLSKTLKAFFCDLPRLNLTPLQLLYLMSPLAFIQATMMAYFSGELAAVNVHMHLNTHGLTSAGRLLGGFGWMGLYTGMPTAWLILNGVLALALNVVSFYANKRIGPVGMSVAANVKQVLTVLCAVVLFDLTITMANGVGIALTLLGGAWYARLEVLEKEKGAVAAEKKERG